MRTLDELVKYTSEEAALYKAKEEAQQLEYAEALRLKKEAHNNAERALARGDQQAYTEAVEIERYNTERARALHCAVLTPRFTKEENNAIVAEARAAENVEVFPLYERLLEMMDEWRDIVQKIDSIHRKRVTCGRYLRDARSRNNKEPVGYEDMSYFRVPSSLELFKTDAAARKECAQMLRAHRPK